MGRTNSAQQSNNTINHFSHPHPLELITAQQNIVSLCSGCKIQANNETIYTCKSCNFFLHQECSKMPQQITHPFDNQHRFTLLPKPIYPEGNFNCDACGEVGDGFSYHCETCGTDLHILCSVFPVSVTHWSHQHQLELKFSPPYPDRSFRCDICKNPGRDHWLYTCQACGFDAHLKCTKLQQSTNSRSPLQQHAAGLNHTNQGISIDEMLNWQEIFRKKREEQTELLQEILNASSRENQARQQLILQGINNSAETSSGWQEIFTRKKEEQTKFLQEVLSTSSRQNQAIQQQILQGINNGNTGVNPYQNILGAAGGMNSGAPILQSLYGGGGAGGIGGGSGGMEALQSLYAGGGGIGGGSGGMELLQSLMGGGGNVSGVGGGLDLSSLFGNLSF